jgi:hypothetical protein
MGYKGIGCQAHPFFSGWERSERMGLGLLVLAVNARIGDVP